MMTTSGCANSDYNNYSVPGNPNLSDYSINFHIDRGVLDSGTYIYGPEGSKARYISGYTGHQSFYDLTLDLKFTDGREYHEKIEIKLLIEEMVKKYKIHDLSEDKWGGMTILEIRIKSDNLIISYIVSERIKEENPIRVFSKRYYYPLFEKTLD
ncbi:hypothetical protein [Desulforhopalus sp. 52FAK]